MVIKGSHSSHSSALRALYKTKSRGSELQNEMQCLVKEMVNSRLQALGLLGLLFCANSVQGKIIVFRLHLYA